jgi:hypothetical protein
MARLPRTALVGLVAVAVLVAGGVGFAQFTASASITGNGQAGSFELIWTAVSLDPSTPSNVILSGPSGPPSTPTGIGTPIVDLAVGPIGPGQTVTFDFTVEDIGNLPVASPTLSYPIPVFNPPACDGTFSGGTVNIPGSPVSLAPMTPLSGTFSITETPNLAPQCVGATESFSFTISGST